MATHKVIAVLSSRFGFKITNITFDCDADFKHALFALVEQYGEYRHCNFISADTFSPITFDRTEQIMGGLGKPYPSDRFATTYHKFVTMCEESEASEHFVRASAPFCRTLGSESGRAGEWFTQFDADFAQFRKDKTKPFAVGVLNNPQLHFELRIKSIR